MFAYRAFSNLMASHISKIERGAKYRDNLVKIQKELEDCYRGFMLEESVPDSASILRCFIDGSYYYKKAGFSVAPIRDFLHLLKTSTPEKKRIILANLHTRLDSLLRYSKEDTDDDIPF